VLETALATGDPRSLAVLLMASLGLRRNEALDVTWGDIVLDGRLLRLRFQLGRDSDGLLGRRPLKTRTSARELRLTGDVARALDAARAGRDPAADPDDVVVSFGDGAPVDPDAMTRWVSSVGRSIGIKVSPHRLRHSAATAMLNAAIETVGKVLGHGDVRTTAVYARVLDTSSDAALDVLARLLGGE
jgi:integrase